MAPFARVNTFTAYTKITAAGHNQNWAGLESFLNAVTFPSSGTLATLAGSETLTNKSLQDSTTYIVDNSDATKKLQFQCSGISTATTRTLTAPNFDGTIATLAGTETFTNKSIDADANTITNIENADIKSGAAIARNKLASGTASHVVINDGSGVMSSEATLATSRGGTNLSSYTAGDLLYCSATNVLSKLAVGTNGQVLSVSSSLPSWTGTLSTNIAVTTKTTTYTATSADDAILADTSGGAWTLSLPAASGVTGKVFHVKKITSDANAVTLDPNSSETIDAWTTYKLNVVNDEVSIVSDGSNWRVIASSLLPVITRYTSGSGTYTTPVGAKLLRVRLVGGGGGGAGGEANATNAGNGGNGGSTDFGGGFVTVAGGSGAARAASPGGAGGAVTANNFSTTLVSQPGTRGHSSYQLQTAYAPAGSGGASPFGGAGTGGEASAAGTAAVANTGSGGGGGSSNAAAGTNNGGAGGGSGGYLDGVFRTPATTYAYTIGSGGSAGSAGTGGFAGAAGADGLIIVEAYF